MSVSIIRIVKFEWLVHQGIFDVAFMLIFFANVYFVKVLLRLLKNPFFLTNFAAFTYSMLRVVQGTGINFTNILRATFTSSFYVQLLRAHIPKVQKDRWLDRIFVLLGSAHVKDVSEMLMKLRPDDNFINILWADFAPVNLSWSYWDTM